MIYKQRFGEPKRGWVLFIHGLGDHSGRYLKLAKVLMEKGMGVYTFDLPGHGKSSGKRGHTTIEKIMEIIDEIIGELKEKPILFGHSFGGLVAIRYAETRPDKPKGVIASSPMLGESILVSNVEKTLVKLLGLIAPTITWNNRIVPELLSRNPRSILSYIRDPLVHNRISARLARSLVINMKKAFEEAGNIKVPIFILAGSRDVISSPKGSQKLFERLTCENKKLRIYEGAYHQIFDDPVWGKEFRREVICWIEELIDQKSK